VTGPGGSTGVRALPEPAPEPVAGRLRDVEARVDPDQIAEVWIFPPLPDLEDSSEFVVLSRYVPDGRRRLYTAGLRRRASPRMGGEPEEGAPERPEPGGAEPDGASPDGGEPLSTHEVTEHGVVPADRVPRLLERFRRRIGEEHEPRHVPIEGSRDRWEALVPRPAPAGGEEAGNPDAEARPPSDGAAAEGASDVETTDAAP